MPAAAKVVVAVAIEFAPTAEVPSEVVPLKNVTVPVAPLLTVAVNVTFAPGATEVGETASVVVDEDFVDVTATAADVEAL